jgi:hypothetical protein
MSSIHGNQDRSFSPDEEHKLQSLEREESSIEAGPHVGFADATRVTKLKSEIDELEEHIQREKQLEE